MNTYKLSVVSLNTLETLKKEKFVVSASFKYEAVSIENPSISQNIIMYRKFDLDESLNIVPYDQLTEEIVLSWLTSVVSTEEFENIQKGLDAGIDSLINPAPVPVETPLPF